MLYQFSCLLDFFIIIMETIKLMENKMNYKHLPTLIVLILLAGSASLTASTHDKNSRSNHKNKQSNHNNHYLFNHGHTNKHIDNRHHHKSPKWHPTNPHTGNFAD